MRRDDVYDDTSKVENKAIQDEIKRMISIKKYLRQVLCDKFENEIKLSRNDSAHSHQENKSRFDIDNQEIKEEDKLNYKNYNHHTKRNSIK